MPLTLFLLVTATFVPSSAYKLLAVSSSFLWWLGTGK